jgi:hypothetical protein
MCRSATIAGCAREKLHTRSIANMHTPIVIIRTFIVISASAVRMAQRWAVQATLIAPRGGAVLVAAGQTLRSTRRGLGTTADMRTLETVPERL